MVSNYLNSAVEMMPLPKSGKLTHLNLLLMKEITTSILFFYNKEKSYLKREEEQDFERSEQIFVTL